MTDSEKKKTINSDRYPISLIALDLDGTLLDRHGKISREDQESIHRAAGRGVEVVISTGRPYIGIPTDVLIPLGVRYAITVNGAAVYRLRPKECLHENCLDRQTLLRLMDGLGKLRVHYDVFIDGEGFTAASTRQYIEQLDLPESMKTYIRTTRTVKEDLTAFVKASEKEIQKMTINFVPGENGQLLDRDAVWELLDSTPGVTAVSGGFSNLEITSGGIKKGTALRFLADYLGIPVRETMAIGDSENDLDIIRTAGIGVAMENAEEIVNQNADFITGSNTASGVSSAIKRVLGYE